jgi:hypothetical protein
MRRWWGRMADGPVVVRAHITSGAQGGQARWQRFSGAPGWAICAAADPVERVAMVALNFLMDMT